MVRYVLLLIRKYGLVLPVLLVLPGIAGIAGIAGIVWYCWYFWYCWGFEFLFYNHDIGQIFQIQGQEIIIIFFLLSQW